MHSSISRTNSIASVTFVTIASCAFLMGFISYLKHEYISPSGPTGKLNVVHNVVGNYNIRHPLMPTALQQVSVADMLLDIDADFTSCFDWNTKLVFAYVVAEYSTKKFPVNQVTIWDHIINGKDEAKLALRGIADYRFEHINIKGLANNANVTLKLKYHIMCHSGVTHMKQVESASVSVQMPKFSDYNIFQGQQNNQFGGAPGR